MLQGWLRQKCAAVKRMQRESEEMTRRKVFGGKELMELAQKRAVSYSMEKRPFGIASYLFCEIFRGVGSISVGDKTAPQRSHHSGFGIHHLLSRSEQHHYYFIQCCWCAIQRLLIFLAFDMSAQGWRALYDVHPRQRNDWTYQTFFTYVTKLLRNRFEPVT